MRFLTLAFLAVLWVAAPSSAQTDPCDPANGWTPGTPCTPADNVGVVVDSTGKTLQEALDDGTIGSEYPATTFSGLGSDPCPANPGQTCRITDSESCTSLDALETGDSPAICRYDLVQDGSPAWMLTGSGGGGGSFTPNADPGVDHSSFDAEVSANTDVISNTSHTATVTGNPHVLDETDVGAEAAGSVATHAAITDSHHTATVDTNTNAQTICTGNLVLDGDGDCVSLSGGFSPDADPGVDHTSFDAEVSANADVAANTATRHAADLLGPDGDRGDIIIANTGTQATIDENSVESKLELQDLQGAVTDAQVPNTITIDLANTSNVATYATTAGIADVAARNSTNCSVETGAAINEQCHQTTDDTLWVCETTLCNGAGWVEYADSAPTDFSNANDLDAAGDVANDSHTHVEANVTDIDHIASSVATDAIDSALDVAAGARTGDDTDLVTGTIGTTGNVAGWDATGNIVDGGVTPPHVATSAAPDSIALTTDTTGNYAAGDAEAGNATGVAADGVDSITDLAASIKTGTVATKVVTGAEGLTDECAKWDANGDLVSAGAACGTGSVDAGDVTYTPALPLTWPGGVDPGDTDEALDSLRAEQVTNEAAHTAEGITADSVTLPPGVLPTGVDAAFTVREVLEGLGNTISDLLGSFGSGAARVPTATSTYSMGPSILPYTRRATQFVDLDVRDASYTTIYFDGNAAPGGDGTSAGSPYDTLAEVRTDFIAAGSCGVIVYVDGGTHDQAAVDEAFGSTSGGCSTEDELQYAFLPKDEGEVYTFDFESTSNSQSNVFTCTGTGSCYAAGMRVINVADDDVFDCSGANANMYLVNVEATTSSATTAGTNAFESNTSCEMVVVNSTGRAGNTTSGASPTLYVRGESTFVGISSRFELYNNATTNTQACSIADGAGHLLDSSCIVLGTSTGSASRAMEVNPPSGDTATGSLVRSRLIGLAGVSGNTNPLLHLQANGSTETLTAHVYESWMTAANIDVNTSEWRAVALPSNNGSGSTLTLNMYGSAASGTEPGNDNSHFASDLTHFFGQDQTSQTGTTVNAEYNLWNDDASSTIFEVLNIGYTSYDLAVAGGNLPSGTFFERALQNEGMIGATACPIDSAQVTGLAQYLRTLDYTVSFGITIPSEILGFPYVQWTSRYGEGCN